MEASGGNAIPCVRQLRSRKRLINRWRKKLVNRGTVLPRNRNGTLLPVCRRDFHQESLAETATAVCLVRIRDPKEPPMGSFFVTPVKGRTFMGVGVCIQTFFMVRYRLCLR